MNHIRPARPEDLVRIAEIEVFNFRLNFYPIFQNDLFYFDELQVPKQTKKYENVLQHIWVYDDGVVKGFLQAEGKQVKKLFVEPVFQSHSVGGTLLRWAIKELDVTYLWALEKNSKAIAFYERLGFHVTAARTPENGTDEYLVRLER